MKENDDTTSIQLRLNMQLSPFLLALSTSLVLLLAPACELGSDPTPQRVDPTFTFEEDTEGWTGHFTDFPVGADTTSGGMALTFDRRPLPDEVPAGNGLFLSGHNTSDDLFMYLRRPISNLRPHTTYALTVEVTMASEAPSGCVGVGGAPGESVYLKAGAASEKPSRRVEDERYRLTLDKGNQAQEGEQARILGTIANGVEQCQNTPYRLIDRAMNDPLPVTTGEDGTLWLVVGTDSGFEGQTPLYYESIRVILEPQ